MSCVLSSCMPFCAETGHSSWLGVGCQSRLECGCGEGDRAEAIPRAVLIRETVEQSVERAAVHALLIVVKMTGLPHFSPWSSVVDNE